MCSLLQENLLGGKKESVTCEFQRHNGETGSVKGETKSAIFGKGECELTEIVRIFGMGKCKLIAKFSATMMTSLPSISLSLSLSPSVPHSQYRKRVRASYNW